uniref:Uncharacterized protein n=1 Tax=Nelumbo nucifera TaxID=4432 RepID=A0A822Z0P7_NELNU|nr:TPA_asm: hypothetical protein HUJ06_007686 [Nelumbo nucifera]DAD37059.1 TPA_asm: hypothetical protein HUJ06_007700 [Nelumbo nucifera]DAD37061.1 TPA_asm: hypothetical protein HUJ06_007702 [Nelumbo nucifera]
MDREVVNNSKRKGLPDFSHSAPVVTSPLTVILVIRFLLSTPIWMTMKEKKSQEIHRSLVHHCPIFVII